jgi:tRNA A-37 threonylcarbamoyl transferase component Bud32
MEQLVVDGILAARDGLFEINDSFVEKSLEKGKSSPAFIEVLDKSTRAILTDSLARVNSPIQNLKEFSTKLETALFEEEVHLPDPRKYLSFDIKLKITDVTLERAILQLLRSFKPWIRMRSPIKIKKIGEILNTVFLIETESIDGPKKVIVKSFDNWIGLKWFPLSLWTIGLRKFSKIGRKRLAAEYYMNDTLKKHSFHVPKIYGLDWDRGLLLEEYIIGTNLDSILKKIARTYQATQDEHELIEKVGQMIGDLHKKGFMLEDCKPENLILSETDHIYIVDLEQASRATDPEWDIAVFLYFAGRYAIRKAGIQIIVKNFIKGYTHVAPSRNILKATKVLYPSFFAPVTPIHIITEITKTCREEIFNSLPNKN